MPTPLQLSPRNLRNRLQVEDPNRSLSALRPQASPVSLYFRPSGIRPKLDNVYAELAALSPRLTEIVSTLNEDAREDRKEAGAAAFADPIRRRAALEKGFGELVRSGEIREAESPFFQIGFFEASAQAMADRYRTSLLSEVPKAAQIADADGNIISPQDIEFIGAELWESLAEQNQVTLANHFGNRRALLLRGEIDREAGNLFNQQIAANTEDAHHRNKSAQLTSSMLELGNLTDATEIDLHLRALSDRITNDIWSANFKDPWATVVDSALAATNVLAAQDPELAAQVLDQLKQLKVGTTSLGEARTDLRNKIALHETSLDSQRRSQAQHANTAGRAETQQAVRGERDVYAKELYRAKQDGGPLAMKAVYDKHVERLLSSPTLTESGVSYGDEALDDLTQLYETLREPDPMVQDDVLHELTSLMRDPAANVDEALETALSNRFITWQQYEALRGRWQQMKSLRDFTYGFDDYQQELRFMSEVYNPADFSPSARLSLIGARQDNIRQFQLAYEAELDSVVKEIGLDDRVGVQSRMRKWLQAEGAKFSEKSNELAEELRARGAQQREKILSGITQGQDMTSEIDAAFERGDITAEGKFSLLAEQNKNMNEVVNTSDDVDAMVRELNARLLDQAPLSLEGPPKLDAGQQQTLENLREELSAEFQRAYTEEREGKTSIDFSRAWDRRRRDLRKQFLQKVETDEQRQQRRFAARGVEDSEERDRKVLHLTQSEQYAEAALDYDQWKKVSPSASVIWRDPTNNTPHFFYEHTAEALEDKFGDVGFLDVRNALSRRDLMRWVAANSDDLDEVKLANIAVTMGSNLGFSFLEIIDNKVRMEGTISTGSVDVDLKEVPINPYWASVFEMQSQLDEWLRVADADKQADLQKALDRLGVPWDSARYPTPIDDPEVLKFYEYQKDALERVR